MDFIKFAQLNIRPKTILDIGANIGEFSCMASMMWPNAYIFSIEANPECEEYLKLNIKNPYLIQALEGAKNLIKQNQPVLFVEMEDCHLKRYNTNSQQLREYIKSELNYDVYQIITDYPCDHLCVPKNTNLSDKKIKFELQKI